LFLEPCNYLTELCVITLLFCHEFIMEERKGKGKGKIKSSTKNTGYFGKDSHKIPRQN